MENKNETTIKMYCNQLTPISLGTIKNLSRNNLIQIILLREIRVKVMQEIEYVRLNFCNEHNDYILDELCKRLKL